jgi:poly-gamma-glutamate synthesis protein (capsule biosynthesis protein)
MSNHPIRKDFDPSGYALTVPFALTGEANLEATDLGIPPTNRDASKMTTVAMSGVTAMVRATAFAMEHYGVTYPGEVVGPLLEEADITHISNEIPFAPDCPFPNPTSTGLVFCSNPEYIDLLEFVGADVIELTGDHFMDYGADDTIYTLDMYQDLGWPYYGGGADAEEARQPVLFEHNGNRIAFMGCNVGCQVKRAIPCTAIATEGIRAAQCDFDWISSEVSRLRQEGYQVIFTFQHIEYYKYTAEPILVQDFAQVAEAGASIVNGSQAHQPHGFGFEGDSYLHYGLGNLFFDQYHFCAWYACDDAFIDRHVFYDGRNSTELIVSFRRLC